MKDLNMTNILKNFDSAEKGTGEIIGKDGKSKANNGATDTAAMKIILESFSTATEGLDADQKRVHQMPGTHKMAKNTDTKHPASNFLVGGEDGEPEAGEKVVSEEGMKKFRRGDKVVPEWESGKGYEPLEVQASRAGKVVVKDDWGNRHVMDEEDLVMWNGVSEEKLGKKQSLSDIFKSMDEADEEKKKRLEKEFHSGIQKQKSLHKGDNGKYDLSESASDEIDSLKAHIDNLARFGASFHDIQDEFKVNNGDTYIVLAKKIVQAVQNIRKASK